MGTSVSVVCGQVMDIHTTFEDGTSAWVMFSPMTSPGWAKSEMLLALESFRFRVRKAPQWAGEGAWSFDADGVPLWFLDGGTVTTYPVGTRVSAEAWSAQLSAFYKGEKVVGSTLSVEPTRIRLAGDLDPMLRAADRESLREVWRAFVDARPAIGVSYLSDRYTVEARAGSVVRPLAKSGYSLYTAIRMAKGVLAALNEPEMVFSQF